MKNITLKIDDETHRRARILAAEQGTSISALVRDYLTKRTAEAASESETADDRNGHEKRVAELDAFFALMDAKAKTRPPRTEALEPLTREEIYASERLR